MLTNLNKILSKIDKGIFIFKTNYPEIYTFLFKKSYLKLISVTSTLFIGQIFGLGITDFCTEEIKSTQSDIVIFFLKLLDLFFGGSWILIFLLFLLIIFFVIGKIYEDKSNTKLTNKKIKTNQIFTTVDEFVKSYESLGFTIPISNDFLSRDKDLENLNSLINTNDIVLVTGKPGVGKTKLTLKLMSDYNKTFKKLFIYSNGLDILDDLQSEFEGEHEKYLIFVDDANKDIDKILSKVLSLKKINDKKVIKIILTSRDYAKNDVLNISRAHGFKIEEFIVNKFNTEEIKQLISTLDYPIKNNFCQKRIIQISDCNPRLAVMASLVVEKTKSIESLNNSHEIYKEYFDGVVSILNKKDNKNLLVIVAIISLFGSIDRNNLVLYKEIEKIFKVSSDDFWSGVILLERLEVLEVHKNEVVKISDQILSDYISYLIFFKNKTIDFQIVFSNFYESLVKELRHVMYSSCWISQDIYQVLSKIVKTEYLKLEDNKKLSYIEAFIGFMETESLNFINDELNKYSIKDININELDFNKKIGFHSNPKILELINYFSLNKNYHKPGIDLLFMFIERFPEKTEYYIHSLTEIYGYKYNTSFLRENLLFEKLLNLVDEGNNQFYSKIFFNLCNYYLKTEFNYTESLQKRSYTYNTYSFNFTDRFGEFRKIILDNLFLLYDKYPDKVLEVLENYTTLYNLGTGNSDDVVSFDLNLIFNHIKSKFNPSSFTETRIVNLLNEKADKSGYVVDPKVIDSFKTSIHNFSSLVLSDSYKLGASFKEYKKIKKEKLSTKILDFSYKGITDIFGQLLIIKKTITPHNKHLFNDSVLCILESFYEINPDDFYSFMIEYISESNYLDIGYPCSNFVIRSLINIDGLDTTFKIINGLKTKEKDFWKCTLLSSVNKSEVNEEITNELIDFYENSGYKIGRYPDFLVKEYFILDRKLLFELLNIIKSKSDEGDKSKLFDFQFFVEKIDFTEDEIKNNLNTFKVLYLGYHKFKNSTSWDLDSDYKLLNKLIDIDPTFVLELIETLNTVNDSYTTANLYNSIWNRKDYEELITQIIDKSFENRQLFFESGVIIGLTNNSTKKVENKKVELLKKLISLRIKDKGKIKDLFDVISNLDEEQRKELIIHFLEENSNIEDFKGLYIEPSSSVYFGSSAVGLYSRKILYIKTIINDIQSNSNLNGISHLKHVQYLEEIIRDYEISIKSEEKRNFTEDLI